MIGRRIRVERGREVRPETYEYRVPSLGIEGRSHQPLLDACRQIQALQGGTSQDWAGIWREGKLEPDMTCSVTWGAAHTVSDPASRWVRFVKWRPFDPAIRING